MNEVVLKKTGIKKIKVPLLGPKYEDVFIEDFTLEGQVYYIISGHGGPDPGAICTDCEHTLCEDEYAYDVALRLARNLMQHGATVYIIVQDPNDGIRDEKILKCDNDEVLHGNKTIPLSQKTRLRQRAEAVNVLYKKHKKKGVKIQKAIEIHVDSRNKDKRQDVFFYYNKLNADSKKLAENVQGVFQSKYAQHQKDRGYQGYVEDRGLYMVRSLLPTMLFVELANIKNTEDHKRLVISTNRQALANWLFEGLRK
ncbi:MAG: N-acetylmuramoyl-L-alanine amidase [Saprospiraceae bacterium]|nr:N-acetylmuramoyl-L-alanine amidase [Saprospiraceae bacterium]